MKAKGHQPYTSEADAKEKLIVYVYEYLVHSGAKQAAETFKENIGYNKEIKVNQEGPGFLLDWWCVFWDLYCGAPERRHLQVESSNDARAFHDFMRTPMSPSITQTSPPQQPQPPQFMGGRGYGMPPGQSRGPPPRMTGPQHGVQPPGPPPGGFMPAASPRFAHHSGPPPPPPQHMNQGGPMSFGPGPDQMGPSPGLNRMTPVGGPPPQQVVGPPNGQTLVGMPPGQQMGGPPGQGPSQVGSMHGGGPPRNGSQGNVGGWNPGNVGYGNVNSPASCYNNGPGSNQPNQGGQIMMSDGSMMEVKSSPINGGEASTPNTEEYVLPGPFGQESSDQCDSAEIMKIKQSMQDDTAKMFEKDQSNFGMADYSDPREKWS